MTLAELRKKNNAALQEHFGGKNPYEERDIQVRKLDDQFFAWCGMDENTEWEEIDFDTPFEDVQEQAAEKGFSVYYGEETTVIFLNGNRVGSMNVSCRGNSFGAFCALANGNSYHASNSTEGLWNAKAA